MPQKILVLDDEENYAKMLHSLLEQHNFLVDSATKPEVALRALEERGYDLVISDYKMPVMDGADFLQKARQINPDLPVILVSGLMNTPELVKVANMSVTLVLEKPIDIENFLKHVKRFVQPLGEEEFHRQKSLQSAQSEAIPDDEGRSYVRSYPAASRYVADASVAMQMFLDDIWLSSREQAHVFIQAPGGSEFELLLREISRWQKQPVDRLILVNVSAEISPRMRQTLGEPSPDCSTVVGVCGYAHASFDRQEAWVDLFREAPESFQFVHLVDDSLFAEGPPRINPELKDLLQEKHSVWPPLRERLSDLAVYVQRLLALHAEKMGLPERSLISGNALSCLLGYKWPGNYRELADVIRRAVALTKKGPVTGSQLSAILARTGVEAPEGPLLTLKEYLRAEQTALLKLMLHDCDEELGHLLERLGVERALAGAARKPEDLGLLYPELLTPPA
ncbi:MAG: response regulator [Verrucomicrobiota bacterium JB024]|nr:response regulator [Verrucomicrobiota bacterium JB024]